MKFFLQRKINANITAASSSTPKYVASFYIRLQTRLAAWIKKHTESFSRGNWILLLLLFIVVTCGYNTYMLVSSFSEKGRNAFTITSIRKPGYLTNMGDVIGKSQTLSKIEYRRIRNFRIYMDSLASSSTGRVAYDSITRSRPGLMDSVRYIDNYYQTIK